MGFDQGLHAAYRATRRMLRATTQAELAVTLADLVGQLGGKPVAGHDGEGSAIDISITGAAIQVDSDNVAARHELDRFLPAAVADARFLAAKFMGAQRLMERATLDPVSGVWNRRSIQLAVSRCRAGDSVAVVDLDRFKAINDTHGHEMGDQVIAAFAAMVQANLRSPQVIGRYGGDEFVIVFPATTAGGASRALHRLRSRWPHAAPVPSTFSAGIAEVSEHAEGQGTPGRQALARADRMLYRAKELGRDRVEFLPSTVDHGQTPHPDSADLASLRQDYFQALMRGDTEQAIAVPVMAVTNGAPPERVIADIIASGQGLIGQAWASGQASVAQEHRASAIAEYALQAVLDEVGWAPGTSSGQPQQAGRVAIAASEGEWHILPGRMAAAVLGLRGLDITLLGATMPPAELLDLLAPDPPHAVVVACQMQLSLVGAWRTITAARQAGTTVIAGGPGFGPDGVWATIVGADHYAVDFDECAELALAAQGQPRPGPRAATGDRVAIAEVEELLAAYDEVLAAALQRWSRVGGSGRGRRREDLDRALRCLASAVLAGDDGVLESYVAWFGWYLSSRAQPLDYLTDAFTALVEVLPAQWSGMAAAAHRAVEMCNAEPSTRRQ